MSRIPPLRFIEPQLASLVDEPPEGKHWIHEIKHDGYRCQVLIERDGVRVFTRNGHDWTDRFPSIARAASALQCKSAILDGEAVIQGESGISNFEAFRQQMLSDRRTLLKRLVDDDADSRIQVSDKFDGDGAALLAACRDMSLEGIVSKHSMAPYRSGRSKTWLKTKCFTESTFVVVGMDRDRKTGALRALLAHNDGGGLNYAGAAFIAISGDERKQFLAELERLTTSWAALKSSRLTEVKWCAPKLMVRVKHLAGSKTLRHATVRGLAN
jgi:bifunctional non-homologous end joining protein LigD